MSTGSWGLYFQIDLDHDPRHGKGSPGPVGALGTQTSGPFAGPFGVGAHLYLKVGQLDTDWVLIGPGATSAALLPVDTPVSSGAHIMNANHTAVAFTDDSEPHLVFPLAADAGNGALVGIAMYSLSGPGLVGINVQAGDSFYFNGAFMTTEQLQASDQSRNYLYVSDGVNRWYCLGVNP